MSEIMEKKDILSRRPTLVRRVSDMFKDGNYSGPPMLFRHASMQKIRHCCQNLNLLPYLLYSFDYSKSHPIARKVHLCLNGFLQQIFIISFFTYQNLHRLTLRRICVKEPINVQETIVETSNDLEKPCTKFSSKFEKPKRKQHHPLYLVVATYLVPLLLVFQVTALCKMTIYCKHTPGFIFLVTALLFLGGIALKIVLHETAKREKEQCEKKKVR
ncbi:uncharacterized protein LOC109854922 isoform X2 [Pseudomyrmex gracilis]|nr:uncharacterized protein LOC109854922 isoform X2 [Pseudomyrmex gracilis]XP_020284144.1 uncharacterized protein LOC109854922 isoform X2 [Pseudomyrmex gracilis]